MVGAGPRHSWRIFPLALLGNVLALAPSVSLLPMVSYQVVSPWWLSLTLRVAVGEVAVSVVPSLMSVVRSLRALLWFTASLMLLMRLVVGVGLCVGGQWPVFGGGRWLVPVALSGRVCSRWRGLLVMLLVTVVQANPLGGVVGGGGVGGAGGVGAVCLVGGWRPVVCLVARVLLLMVLGVCLRLLWPGLGGLLVGFPVVSFETRCGPGWCGAAGAARSWRWNVRGAPGGGVLAWSVGAALGASRRLFAVGPLLLAVLR